MNGSSQWRGATAIVTGASRGIGRATALRLAAEGMKVLAAARNGAELRELEREARGELSHVVVDLRDERQILAMFEVADRRYGGVDVMVNNAGLGHDAPLMGGATEAWREMLEVNVLALCVCTREAVKRMRRADRGHVIHISSMAAHRVPPGSGVYSATKYAVRSLTEGLRQELREHKSAIRVTAISPGYVETAFAAHYHQSQEAAAKTYGRFACIQPEDVAAAVIYALEQPPHIQIHDLLMRPTDQPS